MSSNAGGRDKRETAAAGLWYCLGMVETEAFINIARERCTQCGQCGQVCSLVRFGIVREITAVPPSHCMRCGHCAAVCPQGAVSHPDFPPESLRPVALPAYTAVESMLHARRSLRHFSERPLERPQWEALLAAMALAPSGMNARPVRAMVVTDPETLQALTSHTAAFYAAMLPWLATPFSRGLLRIALGKDGLHAFRANAEKLTTLCRLVERGEDPVLYRAPGVIILHADRRAICGHDDCQLAAMAGMLAAPALGLGACMIGFLLPVFQRMRAIRQAVALPEGHTAYAVLAVGYPALQYRYAPARPSIPTTWQ